MRAAPQEAVITRQTEAPAGRSAAWAYSETFVPEDATLLRARERAHELGCPEVSAGAGALLRVMAAAACARAVVEIGTGAGVSALWLLRGMADDGVLTTIDPDPAHHRAARATFADEGLAPQRTRVITRDPGDVLPRLSDAAYDLVLLATDPFAQAEHLGEAVRLLRPGGVLAIADALLGGRVADPACRDEETMLTRDIGRVLAADDRLAASLVPSGEGLLLAVRRH